jgi:glycine/D-amino acid oxidase-like deaminating enzyme
MTLASSSRRPRITDFEVAVIGGGIVGLCVSWFLAEDGVAVVCIDDGRQSGSIANAGSLHVQMQSRTLRLYPELIPIYEPSMPIYPLAVDYWIEVEKQLCQDIELHVGGGLMVAETCEQYDFLGTKCRRENEIGIATELIGRGELLRLAPYLTTEAKGAVFCPKEGKINPLLANSAIRRKALENGVELRTGIFATAVERGGAGYVVATDAGEIRAGRVVIAAGAGSAMISAKLGIDMPLVAEPLHMNVTEPAEPFMNYLLQHANQPITMKQLVTGQVVIGGGWPARLVGEVGHPTVDLASIIGNLSLAQHMVPSIGDLRVIRTWAGVNPTSDMRSILGSVDGLPGLYFAIPGDAGYTLGPYCARILVEHMAGRDTGIPIEMFSPLRFKADHSGAVKVIS